MDRKVLVLQPDDISYSLLTNNLRELNFTEEHIYRCGSLLESSSVSANEIDIVIADLSQSSRQIRSGVEELKRHFAHVPIVVLSENNNTDTYLEIIRGGGQCLLVKDGFDSQHLAKAIDIAVERNMLLIKAANTAMEYERHFDNGPIPMWIIDEKTMRFVAVNNAAVQKYGYSKEEFLKMSILDIIPPEDVESILEKYCERDSNYYDAGYWRHIKKDGEIFYSHVYSHSTEFANNDARLDFAVDVNAKLKADLKNRELNALIRQQKDQLDSILSSINDAIWSRKADTYELIYGNSAYYRLYNLIPGESELRRDLDMNSIHPSDRDQFYAAINEVKTAGKTEIIYRYINADGSIKTLKANATYIKGVNGKEDTIDGITIDITREKELYDAIRNSEQKLLTTINNTRDLIWSVDRNLKIIYCNKAYQDFFHRLFGVRLDEGDYVLGPWHSPLFVERRKKEYERTLNGESFITLIEEASGDETVYCEISSSPIYDVDGRILGVNCVSRDITAQEMQLNRIKQQNEKLKEIAWIQSHKVRGPVANILGLVSLIEDDDTMNTANKEIIDNLKSVTTHLDAIIKEIVGKTNDIDDADIATATWPEE